ncbi:MAG: DUF4232 domain-containing protein [Cryobacterium sp.]
MLGLRWAVLGCSATAALLMTACGAPSPSATDAPPDGRSVESPAPTESPSATSTLGPCFFAGLAFSLEPRRSRPDDEAAGSIYWDLLVTNTSDGSCSVEGYPQVLLLDAAGTRIGAASIQEPAAGTTPGEVPLDPGASAYSLLRLTPAGPTGCPEVPVSKIAVTPPGGGAAQRVATPTPIMGCADEKTQLVRVGPLAPAAVSF